MLDYRSANWKKGERLLVVLESILVMALLSYFFYRSAFAMIPLIGIGVLWYWRKCKSKVKKDKDILEIQFKECILSVNAALRAGYSIENAFRESEVDMKRLYGTSSYIYTELLIIRHGLVMNERIENLLMDFARRSDLENIEQFSEVLSIAKRTGGNIPDIIRNTSDMITRQIDSRMEIQTILSGKRMEQNIMKLMPFAIILYVGLTSKGYFDSLYGNIKGILIMTGALAIYIAAFFLGEKILSRLEQEM